MPYWLDILKQIEQNTGLSPDHNCIRRVSGGCINSSFLVGSKDLQIFVKINLRKHLTMFEAEAAGLSSIANAEAILSPEALCTGSSREVAFIAMQAINLQGTASATSYRTFGRQLANMHRYHQPRFGASVDNTIGLTPQHNPWSNNWFDFWRKHRLGFQLDLACQNHAPSSLIDDGLRLNENFGALFDQQPQAACLHGDL